MERQTHDETITIKNTRQPSGTHDQRCGATTAAGACIYILSAVPGTLVTLNKISIAVAPMVAAC